MSISGFGSTLAGSTSGSITGIESISVGGIEMDFDEISTLGDTNRVSEHIPLAVRELPIEVTVNYNKTIYNALRTAVLGQTSQTWTLTDVGASTHIGTGYVSKVGGKTLGASGHAQFSFTLQPATKWAFTA